MARKVKKSHESLEGIGGYGNEKSDDSKELILVVYGLSV